MNMKDLAKLTESEINERFKASSQEVLDLRMRKQLGQLKNPAHMSDLRRTLARMKTVLNARKLEKEKKASSFDVKVK